MEQIIDKILEIHRLGCEITEQVPTCGISTVPQWHVHGYKNFRKVADELNNGKYTIEDTGSGPFRYYYKFTHRGVLVFCMSDMRYAEVTA